MKNKTEYLKSTANNFVFTERPEEILVGFDATDAWFARHEIVYPRMFTPEGNALGFKRAGVDAAIALTESLLKEHPEYARGTSFERLLSKVADELIKAVRIGTPHEDYDIFKTGIASWFAEEAAPKTHFIPCAVSPNDSRSFHVGPVTFQFVNGFAAAHQVESKDEVEKFGYNQILEYAAGQGARWIAQVETEGYDNERSAEHADSAVDIALVALQLFIPPSISKEVARSTARTIPKNINTFKKVGDHLRAGFTRADPCMSYSGPYFDMILGKNKAILESVGNRVDAFVKGQSTLVRLDQAWCDAAYWFHEGISEKLDTVAIAKMETSIEVLLFAQSTSGCKNGLLKVFEVIYGLTKNQPLRDNDSRTVLSFIDSVVTARSRVLHGTWSTLNYRKPALNERQHRHEIELLASDLLARFTLQLDSYKKTEKPEDNFMKFLDWISTQKAGM
ncbi:hypothetical protein M3I54_23730 [Paraburkholderia sp. CNPSo 3274]|uniref:hypothetical protein n=1 Tax=Paraburkholderia sp. CNPSo 3274 TaxID=2940932 RepID=UPI0020B78398|nr:hypothetical protein [Paraburkholderia sp. CNPSo 3274]MCP3709954.1 hypothetical protein [Paraburkholderia sp. CNPSo 3274]